MKGRYPNRTLKEADTLLVRFKEFSGVQRVPFDTIFPKILRIIAPRKSLLILSWK